MTETSAQERRPTLFLSCLGTTDYRPLDYGPHEYEAGTAPVRTRFVQLARLETLRSRGVHVDRACILVTTGAKAKNWGDGGHGADGNDRSGAGLETSLRERGMTAERVEVPDGTNADEFWTIFSTVAELVPNKADLYVDLTHGFRTLPMIVLLALEYVEKARGAKIVELTYGADRAVADGTAPTWNLHEFLVIRDWADAVSRFIEDGDTRPLARVARTPTDSLRRALRSDFDADLAKLPSVLEDFGEAILKCHASAVVVTSARVRAVARRAAAACGQHLRLRPLALVLESLDDALSGFPEEPGTGEGRLRAQCAAARWCLEHGLSMQAYTFIRETYVSLFVHLANRPNEKRRDCDTLFGSIGKPPRDDSWQAQTASEWSQRPPLPAPLWAELCEPLDQLTTWRNNFDHAFTGDADSKRPYAEEDITSFGHRCLHVLGLALDHLHGAW